MKKTILVIVGILVIAVGVGSFFAGVQYQKSKSPSRADFQAIREQLRSGERPQGLGERPQAQGGAISGEIIDSDGKSITVKLPDGGSKIVLVSENTAINKAAEGSVDDLKTGQQVMVFGQANSDGSISAIHIQLNFELERGFERMPSKD